MAILAKNGPIKVVLKYDKVSNKFKTVQGTLLYGNEQVKIGDYLIISVLAKRFYNKDIFISVYGFIDDVPTEQEVKDNFEPNQEDAELEEETSKFTEYVTFNEDDVVEDKQGMVIKETDFTKQSRMIDL